MAKKKVEPKAPEPEYQEVQQAEAEIWVKIFCTYIEIEDGTQVLARVVQNEKTKDIKVVY